MSSYIPITEKEVKEMLYIDSDEKDVLKLEKVKYVLDSYKKYAILDEKLNFYRNGFNSIRDFIYCILNTNNTDKSWFKKMISYIAICIIILSYFILLPFVFLFIYGFVINWSRFTLTNIIAIITILLIYFFAIKKLNI